MSADELLAMNFARFAREASPENLSRVLTLVALEMYMRDLPGADEALDATQQLAAAIGRELLGNPLPLTFRPKDVRPRMGGVQVDACGNIVRPGDPDYRG